jgi:hypothetical protein
MVGCASVRARLLRPIHAGHSGGNLDVQDKSVQWRTPGGADCPWLLAGGVVTGLRS